MTDAKDKLVEAYNRIVDELHAAVERAEETLAPTAEELLKNAEELARKTYALTADEARTVAEQVRRDWNHARDYLKTEGKELKQWLRFDLKQVEGRFLDLVAKAADKTWLDFSRFERETRQQTLYHSGEVCSPGVLRCIHCGQEMAFTKATRIPPCPKCHKTEFERVVG
jgi:rubrerythrin